MSSQNLSRLKSIRGEVNNIYPDIISGMKVTRAGIDDTRAIFLLAEMDSLERVIELFEKRAYKESFILLRTVIEKFLYFWLMLEGKRYRWTKYFRVNTKSSSDSVKEGRDNTVNIWRDGKKKGFPDYRNIIDIQPDKKQEDIIVVTYEDDGYFLTGDKLRLDEFIPSYMFMLDKYDPQTRFVSQLQTIREEDQLPDIAKQRMLEQKMIYNQFIYFEHILRNLSINGLITKKQSDMIIVHYNFLSSFVHISKISLDIWTSLNSGFTTARYDENILRELIFLYVSKLMHLYLKVIVEHYKKFNQNFVSSKYEIILNNLDLLSRPLWFFDTEPTIYDKKVAEMEEQIAKARAKILNQKGSITKRQTSTSLSYYKDPIARIAMLRKYGYPFQHNI